jgi:hypothetical protein
LVLVADDAAEMLRCMKQFRPPGEVKWVK